MKIGFIGTGNMGTALIKGFLAANQGAGREIFAYDQNEEALHNLVQETGIQACDSIAEAVNNSQILILAVKPDAFDEVLKELVAVTAWEQKVIVSIAAGISLRYIASKCYGLSGYPNGSEDFPLKIVRVMPNTPALIGKGMSGLSRNSNVSDEEFKNVMAIFSAVGKAEQVDEKLMDGVVAVSGSSPAYAYLFIEALADGAVALGMTRKQAYIFAAQSVAGSAEMVLQTGLHPGELKDRVCSPGGTTIAAVEDLEQSGFRGAVISAVKAAADKSVQMTK